MSKGAILILLIIAFGFCFAPKADGAVVTISIEAVVDTVEDEGNYLEGQILPGNIITGYYTYESTTPDTNPEDPVLGNYWHYSPPAGVFLTVGGFNFYTDNTNTNFRIVIRDNTPSDDIYGFESTVNLPLPNGTIVDEIYWSLKDYTASVLSSDLLPTTAPNLNQWDENLLSINGEKGTFGIGAHVISAVPEPATLLLFSFGITFLRKK